VDHNVKILGAVIAGGASRRFGSDKASALLAGRPLLDHICDALRAQADGVIVVGRDWPGLTSVTDRPAPNLGPLGGICAALQYGLVNGFDAVLTTGCDILPLPDFADIYVADVPTVVEDQPLLGCWPCAMAPALEAHLKATTNLSVYHWLDLIDAAQIKISSNHHNFNTPADLAAYADSLAIHPR
jgi:molybdenum cofactor guanylyltransferase